MILQLYNYITCFESYGQLIGLEVFPENGEGLDAAHELRAAQVGVPVLADRTHQLQVAVVSAVQPSVQSLYNNNN